jgi:hypothetical protein
VVVEVKAAQLLILLILPPVVVVGQVLAVQVLLPVPREQVAPREIQDVWLQYFVCPFAEGLGVQAEQQVMRVRRVIREQEEHLGQIQVGVIKDTQTTPPLLTPEAAMAAPEHVCIYVLVLLLGLYSERFLMVAVVGVEHLVFLRSGVDLLVPTVVRKRRPEQAHRREEDRVAQARQPTKIKIITPEPRDRQVRLQVPVVVVAGVTPEVYNVRVAEVAAEVAAEMLVTPVIPVTPAQQGILQLLTAFLSQRGVSLSQYQQTDKLLFLGTHNSNVMNEKELQKELDRRHKLRQLEALEANETRAQSLTVGTAGGGTVEITMRSSSGRFLWNTYQPVEVVEFINQLAAGIGCHIHILPRQDFASWRNWKVTPEELAHARSIQPFQGVGHSPHPKMLGKEEYTAGMAQQIVSPKEEVQEKENVATKKAVNKRNTKRSRSSTK